MNDLKYIIYSHTDYLDILSIQTEYLKNYKNKTLLINRSNLELKQLYEKYEDVIFYEDTLPYASRLLSLSSLKDQYILFIHDIDIVIQKENSIINYLRDYMFNNNIDRIDLQCRYNWDRHNKEIKSIDIEGINFELRRQTNVNNYIYNVNPSIWKLSTLLNIMSRFKDDTYRSIENGNVMSYCKQFFIYKLYSNNLVNCGWFMCLPFFQFIHITHGGKLLPKHDNNLNHHLTSHYEKISDLLSKDNKRQFFNKKINKP